jgi:hypothetical protein
MNELLLEYWGHWLGPGPHDEEEFLPYVMALVGKIQEYSYLDDWEGMDGFWELYRSGIEYFREEPLATPYDLGSILIALLFAGKENDLGNYAEAHRHVATVFGVLNTGDQRRALNKIEYRPNSEVRIRCLGILAEGKFSGPHELRDEVLSPEEIVEEFNATVKMIHEYLAKFPSNDRDSDLGLLEAMTSIELELCKMVLRHCPGLLAGCVANFNRRHNEHLAVETGHFRDSPESDRSFWYWDFEIAKLWLSSDLTADELNLCHIERINAMERSLLDWDKTSLIASFEEQMTELRSRIRSRFEVVERRATSH